MSVRANKRMDRTPRDGDHGLMARAGPIIREPLARS